MKKYENRRWEISDDGLHAKLYFTQYGYEKNVYELDLNEDTGEYCICDCLFEIGFDELEFDDEDEFWLEEKIESAIRIIDKAILKNIKNKIQYYKDMLKDFRELEHII